MFFFPIGTDRPQRIFPWINVLLIAANVVLYVMSTMAAPGGVAIPGRTMSGLLPGWDNWMLNPMHLELSQFIKYQFIHASWMHLLGNMLFLYVFGNNLNEKLGHVGYLAFYLAGGVLAGCGHVLTDNHPTLGASGSISAVAGLFLLLLPRTHIRVFVCLFIFYIDVWEVPSMFFILFKFGQDVLEQVWMGQGNGVAYMAHISGTFAGAAIGLVLLLTHLVQRDHYDMLAMLNRYRRRKTYESLVARGYEPFTQPGPGKPQVLGSASVSRRDVSAPDPRIESLRVEIARLIRMHALEDGAARYLELLALFGGGENAAAARPVLNEQDQLDVANQLMADGHYAEAALAYEDYLRVYGGGSGSGAQRDQVTLMLGVLYARYLGRPERARELLQNVLPRLHNDRERQMAQGELEWMNRPPGAPGSTSPA